MVMYEEGRRKGKFRGKSGPGTVDVRTVSNVYSSIGVEFNITDKHRERSGSVVECLIRDRRVAGSSLTGVTALWSLSKTHLS